MQNTEEATSTREQRCNEGNATNIHRASIIFISVPPSTSQKNVGSDKGIICPASRVRAPEKTLKTTRNSRPQRHYSVVELCAHKGGELPHKTPLTSCVHVVRKRACEKCAQRHRPNSGSQLVNLFRMHTQPQNSGGERTGGGGGWLVIID